MSTFLASGGGGVPTTLWLIGGGGGNPPTFPTVGKTLLLINKDLHFRCCRVSRYGFGSYSILCLVPT